MSDDLMEPYAVKYLNNLVQIHNTNPTDEQFTEALKAQQDFLRNIPQDLLSTNNFRGQVERIATRMQSANPNRAEQILELYNNAVRANRPFPRQTIGTEPTTISQPPRPTQEPQVTILEPEEAPTTPPPLPSKRTSSQTSIPRSNAEEIHFTPQEIIKLEINKAPGHLEFTPDLQNIVRRQYALMTPEEIKAFNNELNIKADEVTKGGETYPYADAIKIGNEIRRTHRTASQAITPANPLTLKERSELRSPKSYATRSAPSRQSIKIEPEPEEDEPSFGIGGAIINFLGRAFGGKQSTRYVVRSLEERLQRIEKKAQDNYVLSDVIAKAVSGESLILQQKMRETISYSKKQDQEAFNQAAGTLIIALEERFTEKLEELVILYTNNLQEVSSQLTSTLRHISEKTDAIEDSVSSMRDRIINMQEAEGKWREDADRRMELVAEETQQIATASSHHAKEHKEMIEQHGLRLDALRNATATLNAYLSDVATATQAYLDPVKAASEQLNQLTSGHTEVHQDYSKTSDKLTNVETSLSAALGKFNALENRINELIQNNASPKIAIQPVQLPTLEPPTPAYTKPEEPKKETYQPTRSKIPFNWKVARPAIGAAALLGAALYLQTHYPSTSKQNTSSKPEIICKTVQQGHLYDSFSKKPEESVYLLEEKTGASRLLLPEGAVAAEIIRERNGSLTKIITGQRNVITPENKQFSAAQEIIDQFVKENKVYEAPEVYCKN